jgi:hypothetical protein
MARKSVVRQLIERQIEGDLEERVAEMRRLSVPWRAVAAEVSRLAGVEVSDESLRRWFGTSERVSAGQTVGARS